MRPGEYENSVILVIRVEDDDKSLRHAVYNTLPDGTLSLVPETLDIFKECVSPHTAHSA
jgi:hypothetical protein